MVELIHDREALVEVATTFSEPARSWARALLALWFRDLSAGLPHDHQEYPAILLSAPEQVAQAVHDILQSSATPSLAFLRALTLGHRYGLDLGPPQALVSALRRHLGDSASVALRVAELLAHLGELDAATLRAAATAPTSEARIALPTLAIRFGVEKGGGLELVRSTLAQCPPQDLYPILCELGPAWPIPVHGRDADAVVTHLAERVGGELPPCPARGSRKLRAAAWVRTLAQARTDPFSLTAHALSNLPLPPGLLERIAGMLVILRSDAARDPVQSILQHLRWEPRILAQARQVLDPTLVPLPPLSSLLAEDHFGAALLVAPHQREASTAPLLERLALAPVARDLAGATLPGCGEALPAHLERAGDRSSLFRLAALTPSGPVLETLLRLPIPHDPEERAAYLFALASMGSPDCAERVRLMAHALPDLDAREGLALLDALHL
ncbi:MAG: hypothetical protein EA397_19155 [Deltaproteobacteria bacterium]|nr:MAG: hypothetical protein EA397_19155 [Deltaproteobacteria bacterium]